MQKIDALKIDKNWFIKPLVYQYKNTKKQEAINLLLIALSV